MQRNNKEHEDKPISAKEQNNTKAKLENQPINEIK